MEEKGKAKQQKRFPSLEVVTNYSDHHYCNKKARDNFEDMSCEVHKRIMKEWRILKQDLPESINVRVYEQRIDLLRAMIVGPAGTPYHDGLFFFDFAFPADYPNRPPMVRYRSFGYCINPNLYSSGYVCLSLLNTWPGNAKQRWNPSQSTIWQVLVSIQALVLNQLPYYNEPMLSSRNPTQSALNYNEHVFQKSCKTMLHLLRRPPLNFEDLVATHFRERGVVILKACDAYMNNRVRVGYYGDGHNGPYNRLPVANLVISGRFKPLFDELLTAFAQNQTEVSLGQFFEDLKEGNLGHLVEKLKNDHEKMVATERKKLEKKLKKRQHKNLTARFVGKLVGKIKKVLGMK